MSSSHLLKGLFAKILGEKDAGIYPGRLERMLPPHLSAVCEDKFNLFQKM